MGIETAVFSGCVRFYVGCKMLKTLVLFRSGSEEGFCGSAAANYELQANAMLPVGRSLVFLGKWI